MIIELDDELRGHPQVVDIENTLQAGAVAFTDLVPLFERILASELPLAALRIALRRIAADASYQLSRFVMEEVLKGWTFLVTNRFAVSIGVRTPWRGAAGTEPQSDSAQSGSAQPDPAPPGDSPPTTAAHGPRLQPYPFDLFMGSLGGDSYEFERYSVAAPVSAAAGPALAWQARGRMHVGSSMLLRAGLDMVTSRLPGSLVYLEISGPVQCAILPQFDQITHRFAGWISGDSTASRLELLTRTLAEFEFQPAAPRLAALTRHRDHYVRWNSLRDLLRLDPELGLEHLQHALADEHAEIRELAGWTLGRVARERQAFRAVAQES